MTQEQKTLLLCDIEDIMKGCTDADTMYSLHELSNSVAKIEVEQDMSRGETIEKFFNSLRHEAGKAEDRGWLCAPRPCYWKENEKARSNTETGFEKDFEDRVKKIIDQSLIEPFLKSVRAFEQTSL